MLGPPTNFRKTRWTRTPNHEKPFVTHEFYGKALFIIAIPCGFEIGCKARRTPRRTIRVKCARNKLGKAIPFVDCTVSRHNAMSNRE